MYIARTRVPSAYCYSFLINCDSSILYELYPYEVEFLCWKYLPLFYIIALSVYIHIIYIILSYASNVFAKKYYKYFNET